MEDAMSNFLPYSPDQAYLLPPSVKDILDEDHLCFFIHAVVERLDLSDLAREYGMEGRKAYAPALMVKVWLYAFALGVSSTRRLEQRIREDLGFRYLAGGQTPDHWTLNEFLRRHRRTLNDLFTQVLELAREMGLLRIGQVAIDSTKVVAKASPDRIDTESGLRRQRARLRRQIRSWQQKVSAQEANEQAGMRIGEQSLRDLQQRLEQIPQRLARLRKSGERKLSRTDPEARFLRRRGSFVLGYSAELAVNQDHLIVARRLTQNPSDAHSLLPMVDLVKKHCCQAPQQVSGDSGFFKAQALRGLERQKIDAYVPDSNLGRELNGLGRAAAAIGRMKISDPVIARMRRKLRSPAGRAIYKVRKTLVEPVNGNLKEKHGLYRFRRRGLAGGGQELNLACTAYNLLRLRALGLRL
jgi:transposase